MPSGAWVQRLAQQLHARCIETHISWVLLTDRHALKIKKPVTLPFLDYGSLAARERFCHDELRLNQRLAPSLYLDVVALTGSADAPQVGGDGPLLDHALRMRRFADGALFSERLAAGRLQAADVDRLAQRLGHFHLQAPVATAGAPWGTARRVAQDLRDVVQRLAAARPDVDPAPWQAWVQAQVAALSATWDARQRNGFVREGHGDLHLANLVCLDDADGGEATAFDAIEFDPALRWIDIAADIAFAVMDLQAHGRADLAWRLLDGWLAVTGDHAALAVLRPYLVYRALVRAMVGGLRPGDAAADHMAAAAHWRDGADPRLLITEGLPGSGKSRLALALLQACGAVRLRSDVERKRLRGLGALQSTASPVGAGAYDADATQRTYARLLHAAEVALRAGWRVVVDAAFLRAEQRAAFVQLAAALRVPCHILCCDAPDTVLLQRLQQRADAGADASEADARVLAWLRTQRQSVAAHEQARALHAGPDADVDALARAWLRA